MELASAAGNNFSGDTNVQAGTLLADTDNALSPASNLVIGDGASVVLNFGNVGAGFGLGGFGAAAAGRGPGTGRASATRAGRHLDGARAGHAGAVARRSPGQPGRMAAKEPMNETNNGWRAEHFYSNPNPFLHAPLARLPWQVEKCVVPGHSSP